MNIVPPEVPDTAAEPTDDEPAPRKSVATLLVELALEEWDFGCTLSGKAFAVPKGGGHARIFRGSSTAGSSLRTELAARFYDVHGRAANASGLAEALVTLEGRAMREEPVELAIRVARHEGAVIVDLGDRTDRVVCVTPGKWEVLARSPVLFRRTKAIGVMPEPIAGGSLTELRALLNISDDHWPLLVGWLVAALIEDLPHPVLSFSGPQGSAKSEAARAVVRLIDPSDAPLRTAPRDPHDWGVAADASWAVALDNLSGIQPWFSDLLCKAVTGDGVVTRTLYSDEDVTIRNFRRAIVFTSIDFGAARGDLAERMLALDLEPISEGGRRTEADVRSKLDDARPRILGALFTLLAGVLHVLPEVRLDRMPRMADFAKVLAAVDFCTELGPLFDIGTEISALESYQDMGAQVARSTAEGDPVALAIATVVHNAEGGHWEGMASDLHRALSPYQGQNREWPKTPHATGAAVRRVLPALRALGVEGAEIRGRSKTTTWVLMTAEAGEHYRAEVPTERGTLVDMAALIEAGRAGSPQR